MRKYYVGAKHIGRAIGNGTDAECMRNTPDDAIQEAKRMIQETPGMDCAVVVEVIAVVKRSPPPVIVEYVRDKDVTEPGSSWDRNR